MSTKHLLIVAVFCLAGSGCRLAHNAWLTTVAEPIHYPRNLDEKLSRRRFTSMAEFALDDARASTRAELDDYECNPYSADYERGFVDGFVDYLDAGGTGAPPPLPPRDYWKPKYQTPVGHQCVLDWFAGYEHGAGVARGSNYRSFVIVPLSDAVRAETQQTVYGRISTTEETDFRHDERDEGTYVESDSPARPQRLDDSPLLSRVRRVPAIESSPK